MSYYYSSDEAVNICSVTIFKFIASDGKFEEKEWQLMCYIVNQKYSYDACKKLIEQSLNIYSDSALKRIFSKDDSIKQSVAELGLAISSIDGQISMKEEDLLDYLTE